MEVSSKQSRHLVEKILGSGIPPEAGKVARAHRGGIRVNGETLRMIHRVMLIASLVGLFASVYLLITYISGKPIVCGANAGCEIVRASKWAYTFGIPRPAFGVIFYLAVIFLLATHAYAPHVRPRTWRLAMLIVGTAGFIESAFLTLVQWLDIRAFCLWCLISAAAATLIFILSLFDGREPPDKEVIVRELKFIFHAFLTALFIGGVVLYVLLRPTVSGA
ncbi:MAG: vitamin K epoxide reductase family protein [Patescibacteria group bacterium]